MDDPKPWLTLARVPGLHAGRLAGATATPLAWLADSRSRLAQQGFSEAAIAALLNPDPRGLDRDEAWLAGPGRSLVTWGSTSYPTLLAAIPDAPLVLFVEGAVAALSLPQLAWRDGNANYLPDWCEPDRDGDTVIDVCDNCPHLYNPDQAADSDGDGTGDACDICAGHDDKANADTDSLRDDFDTVGMRQDHDVRDMMR